MFKSIFVSLALLGAGGVAFAVADDKPAEAPAHVNAKPDAKAALAALGKALIGSWQIEPDKDGKDQMPGTIEFRHTSAGKVLMETMFPGTESEMVNLYHIDNGELLVTHYCAMGNQPRMKLVSVADGTYTFEFKDGTNLPAEKPQYMGGLVVKLADGKVEERWTFYSDGKAGETMTMSLARK